MLFGSPPPHSFNQARFMVSVLSSWRLTGESFFAESSAIEGIKNTTLLFPRSSLIRLHVRPWLGRMICHPYMHVGQVHWRSAGGSASNPPQWSSLMKAPVPDLSNGLFCDIGLVLAKNEHLLIGNFIRRPPSSKYRFSTFTSLPSQRTQ